MYGIINFRVINTDPGANTAFAPPEGWDGDYSQYMRERWKNDPGVRQHVIVVGRLLSKGEQVAFVGKFATEARRIAERAWRGGRHGHVA